MADLLLLESASGLLEENGTDHVLLEYDTVVAATTPLLPIREKPPLRTSWEVETPSGRFYRWAGDEPNAENIPSGARDSSTIPGGYESCDITLPRKPSVDYADLERFSTVRGRGAGGEVFFEGRLERAPKTSGDRMSVEPGCVGWQAHMDDDKSAREIYIDRDLSRWGPISRAYRVLLVPSWSVFDPQAVQDPSSGRPVVMLPIAGAWTNRFPLSSAVYDAGEGLKVGYLYSNWSNMGAASLGDANWSILPYSSPTGYDSFTALQTDRWVSPFDSVDIALTTPQRFVMIEWTYAAKPAGAADVEYSLGLLAPVVCGDHNLTRRGTGTYGEPGGLYMSDVVAHAVGKWCPKLNYTTGTDGTIRPSSLVVNHLTFNDPTTVSDIVRQATRFELQDWAVWEDKTFWWYPRDALGRKWRARVAPAQLQETGADGNRVWNSILVEYRDVDGTTRTVGPPGSGADTESSDLEDTDPENPANKLGIVRRDKLQMGTSTPAGAIAVGNQFLLRTRDLDSSGKATLVGWVEDDRGVLHPYHRVRAGDQICFVDSNDTSYRRVVRAERDHASRSCSVDIDAPPDGLAALLERLGVVLQPLGL
jgi:hypothetical protein